MKLRFHIFYSIVLSVLLGGPATAQQNNVDSLVKKFEHYAADNLQEKIYVHLDRPAYLTGETAWFKVYLVESTFHMPLGVSKVVYVEIIDRNNLPVVQTKIEMKDGVGSGSVYLQPTLSTGNYTLRAYTNWMKNYSPEFFFHKTLRIVNTFRSPDRDSTVVTTAVDAQFFPEGGNLVAGLKSKVAFRVIDATGKGIDFKGAILDQNKDTVQTFAPKRFGIGSFTITPQVATQYKAVLQFQNGVKQVFNLPAVATSGYVMTVSDTTNNQVVVRVSGKQSDDNSLYGAYLFVHGRNRVVEAKFQTFRRGKTSFIINTSDLIEGISHFTIFDDQLKPVCERLYFKQPDSKLNLSAASDQSQYGLRRPVRVALISSVKDKPEPSNLSISIYKKDSLGSGAGNIHEYLLLTSDLQGAVESPEFYFSNSIEAKEGADNLMLTHGWRRFKWDDVTSNKKNVVRFVPEYKGHIIHGSVRKEDGSTAAGVIGYLSSPGKIIWLYPARSNEQGDVLFEMQNFYGDSKIIAQTNPKKDSAYSLSIRSPFSDKFAKRSFAPFRLSTVVESQLVERSVAMQVQEIYFSDQFVKARPAPVDSAAFYGKADESYLLDDYTRFPIMEEIMREYVPGVMVRKRKDGFHFIVMNSLQRNVFNETPLVLLDGVPIFDEDEIMEFDPLRVKKLEVMTRRWFLGPLSFTGIVSYSTYHGDLAEFKLNPKAITLNYEGLQLRQEFYAPKYETQKRRESRLPDQRNVLYWNPEVLTSTDGKVELEFYTSDIPGEYNVVVEGITNKGQAGSATASFLVRDFNN